MPSKLGLKGWETAMRIGLGSVLFALVALVAAPALADEAPAGETRSA